MGEANKKKKKSYRLCVCVLLCVLRAWICVLVLGNVY